MMNNERAIIIHNSSVTVCHKPGTACHQPDHSTVATAKETANAKILWAANLPAIKMSSSCERRDVINIFAWITLFCEIT
jgi:hypothetical protein